MATPVTEATYWTWSSIGLEGAVRICERQFEHGVPLTPTALDTLADCASRIADLIADACEKDERLPRPEHPFPAAVSKTMRL
jgi:hypothetical protein